MTRLFWLGAAALLLAPALGVGCGDPFEAGGGGGSSGGGEACSTESDCSGVDDACKQRRCSNGTCGFAYAASGNGCESGVCDGAGECVECVDDVNCNGEVCVQGLCVPANCVNGELDGNETDLDCGGDCPGCNNGDDCLNWTDCQSAFCDNGVCAPCGGHDDCPESGFCNPRNSCVPKKPNGDGCDEGIECQSGNCPGQDTVCCDALCSGACNACRFSKTGLPNGECHPVLVDTDPDDECPPICSGGGTAPQVCNGDGSCVAGNVITSCSIGCHDGVCLACGMNPPPSAPSCPTICSNGCNGGVCQINCSSANNCTSPVNCPPGLPCIVMCIGVGGCQQKTINCPPSHGCSLVCDEDSANLCSNALLNCGAGSCDLSCGPNSGACGGVVQTCGPNACTQSCDSSSGEGPVMTCGNACLCTPC